MLSLFKARFGACTSIHRRWLLAAPISIAIATFNASCGQGSGVQAPAAKPEPTPAALPIDYDQWVPVIGSYLDAGKAKRAAEVAAQAVELAPERPEAFGLWGRALAMQKRLAESAEKYEQARALGSRNRAVFAELSSVYDVSGDYPRAIEVYQAWLSQHPDDADMHQQLGLTLLLTGQPDQSVLSLQAAVDIAPQALQLQQDLGYALLHAGRFEEADEALSAVVKADKGRGDAVVFLARVRLARGKYQSAIELLEPIASSKGATAARKLLARLQLLTGAAKDALASYQALAAELPDDPTILLGTAGALLQLDDPEGAVPLIEKAAQAVGEHPLVTFRREQVAWRRGDRKAADRIRKVAEDKPDHVEAWRELLAVGEKLKRPKLRRLARKRLHALGAQP